MQFESYTVKRLFLDLALLFRRVWDNVTEITVSRMQQTGRFLAMYDARSVANELLRLAKSRGLALTNMQVQKIVYIAHGYSLAILHRPLVRLSIEAWRYGPVIPDLYHALRRYGAGIVTDSIPIINMDKLTETDRKLLATVLDAYGRFTGPQLSTMTHREGTPWREFYQPNASFNNDTISPQSIERHYTELLNARAGIAAN
jgi:uncharacterized phage-associated protein